MPRERPKTPVIHLAAKNKQPPALTDGLPVSAAVGMILRHDFAIMLAQREIARVGVEPEGVHQMRVALRRMRSAMALFQALLEPEQARPWRQCMRELASQLGRARDLDVFIHEGLAEIEQQLPLPGMQQLRSLALDRRAQVQDSEVLPMLTGEALRHFCTEFLPWLDAALAHAARGQDKRARRLARPILGRARKLLDRREARVRDAGRSLDRQDAQAMHLLRIECKKLRYAAEFFRSLFPDMGQFISSMKGIQDVLGVMNDLAMTQVLLDDLLREQENAPELHHAAGALLGWRVCRHHQLLGDFDQRWETWRATRRPWRD